MTDYSAFGATTTTGQGGGAGAGLVRQVDAGAYTFGQRFRVDTSGLSVTKVRFYVPAGSPNGAGSGYRVAIYDVGGSTPLQQAGPVTAVVGWNEVSITPVPVSVGNDYMAAVVFPNGYYSAQSPNAVPWDPSGPLEFYVSGSFNSGSTLTYPATTSGSSPSYGVDVVVSDGVSGLDVSGTVDGGASTASGTITQSMDVAGTVDGSASSASAGTVTASLDVSGTADSSASSAAGSLTTPISVAGTVNSGASTASGTITGPVAGASSTAMSRRIARLWFSEPIGVERLQGDGAYGSVFAAVTTIAGAIDHGSKEVMTPTGDTRISSARVFLPVETDAIPLGSRVTLPDVHGGGTHQVVAVNVHRSAMPTPDHLEVALL